MEPQKTKHAYYKQLRDLRQEEGSTVHAIHRTPEQRRTIRQSSDFSSAASKFWGVIACVLDPRNPRVDAEAYKAFSLPIYRKLFGQLMDEEYAELLREDYAADCQLTKSGVLDETSFHHALAGIADLWVSGNDPMDHAAFVFQLLETVVNSDEWKQIVQKRAPNATIPSAPIHIPSHTINSPQKDTGAGRQQGRGFVDLHPRRRTLAVSRVQVGLRESESPSELRPPSAGFRGSTVVPGRRLLQLQAAALNGRKR
jgi:hypothetical protein